MINETTLTSAPAALEITQPKPSPCHEPQSDGDADIVLHNARDAKEKLAVAKATEEVVAAIMALGQKRPALGSALVDCICSNAAAKAIAHKYLIHPSVLSYWSRRLGLPDRVITDNGGEFSSFDFELLAARYEMAIEKRPPAKPRFGGVIERMFGTINTQLLYQLWGNTQATKANARTVTKSNDPTRLACWTLAEFDRLFGEYVYRVYDSAAHPALGMSPAEAFVKGLEKGGHRPTRLVPYDESFVVWCLPSTRTGLAKVQPRAGIKVNYLYYWNDSFRSAEVEGTKLRVKVDPFNAGIVYALLKRRWLRCVSQYHHFFNGRSLKEVIIATEELRKAKSGVAASKLISAKKLLDFMAGPEEVERLKQQREKDKERQLAAGLNEAPPDPEKVMPFPAAGAALAEQPGNLNLDHDFKEIEEAREI
ncbi:MAG: hypothetical protein WAO21_09700 [Verrucomicrobiia bacterium]